VSIYLHKSHNVTVLLYHLVFPAKYRRAVIDPQVDEVVKEVCLAVERRYQIKFLEIGTDEDHVHFLVQSVPTYSVTKIVTLVKSLTAREVFGRCPAGEEATLGRGVLDGRVLRRHGGQARERTDDGDLREAAGPHLQKAS